MFNEILMKQIFRARSPTTSKVENAAFLLLCELLFFFNRYIDIVVLIDKFKHIQPNKRKLQYHLSV